MSKTVSGDLPRLVERLLRRAATTLSPDRAILIECAFEAETDSVRAGELRRRIDRFNFCAENASPLRYDFALIIVFVEKGSDCAINDLEFAQACKDGAELTGLGEPVTVYNTVVAGDTLSVKAAVLDERSLSRERVFATELLPGDAEFEKLAANAVNDSEPDEIVPCVVGIGVADNAEYAVRLARLAVLRPSDTPSHDKTYAEAERRILARVNREGSRRQTAISAAVEVRGAGHVAVLPADCFTFAARMQL